MFKNKIVKIGIVSTLLATTLMASNNENSHGSSTNVQHKTNGHISHWDYKDTKGWGHIKSDYADCSNGKRQSPIDVQTHNAKTAKTFDDIFVSYGKTKLNIINNGHTIQVNSDGESFALLNGKEYKLLQFHFHSASEHTINGNYSPMEVHLVHQAEDGELGVIGVMINEGKHNSFLQKVFKFMPRNADGKTTNKHMLNANEILPKDKSYFHYMGSLTTPPCTQIVQWYVMKNPITVSAKQLKQFNALYKGNFRPVQEMNGRKLISK